MPVVPDVAELSLEERIGQVLCFGWQGATGKESRSANAHARELVESMHCGSVALLGRNVDSGEPWRTRAMLDQLQSLSRIPLFVAIDQEGGSVNRFRAPSHEFAGNMALGAIACGEMGMSAGEVYARRQAEAQARELLAVGVNWNFAPVVDVNNNPDNPTIGVRSYGADPHLVARLGVAAVRGYQDAGLLACAKHFPGHGDTDIDSHLALPSVRGDRARIDSVELVPFNAVILEGIGAIMTSHILYPHLDPAAPATLSRAILTCLLRQELGFDGLVITDCLEMDAVAKTVGTQRGAVEALKAGADIVLVCHTLKTQREAVRAIRRAIESGELSESRLNEAVARVLAAKRRFLVDPPPAEGVPWADAAIDSLEREIAEASITVVRNGGAIPVVRGASVLAVSMHPALEFFANCLRRHSVSVNTLAVDTGGVDDVDLEDLEEYGVVIVLTCPHEPWSDHPIDQEKQARMVRVLSSACREDQLIVVAIREPYDLRRFDRVPTYVCTYGYRRRPLDALADVLLGACKPTAKLPVTIPGSSNADMGRGER